MSRGTTGRFALVGVANTAIDVGLFTVLTAAGSGIVLANTASTTAGMVFSFAVNRTFSFRSTTPVRHVIVPFLAVYLVCLWVLHPLVILGSVEALGALGVTTPVSLVLGKVAAVASGLVWNYLWYLRVVFADRGVAQ